jgi:chemotaxis protein methyltransferase CheR
MTHSHRGAAAPAPEAISSVPQPVEVTPAQFREIRHLAHSTFGLDLKDGKEALVAARLAKRLRELHLPDIGSYLELLRADCTGAGLIALTDALTTNFTDFLREPEHFDVLGERILPEVAASRAPFTIWSAACSTGEEPYTILFQTADTLVAMGREDVLSRFRLLASDISTRALGKAQDGVYPAERLKELPEAWLRRYLQKGIGARQGFFRVQERWRSRVEFFRLNLMDDFSHLPRCRVIFCRNVMIYFSKATQEGLVNRLAERLAPGGWLLIRHSEGLMGIRHGLEYVLPAVYRRPR